jgi:hypothetical protein
MPFTEAQIETIIAKATAQHKSRGNTDLDESAIEKIRSYASANPEKIVVKRRDGWSEDQFANKLTSVMQTAHDNLPAGQSQIGAVAMGSALNDCIC